MLVTFLVAIAIIALVIGCMFIAFFIKECISALIEKGILPEYIQLGGNHGKKL